MTLNTTVYKGVILAAGDGDRLGPLTATCPKVLLSVNDQPIISYPIQALAAAGIKEIAVVVGYLGDKVIKELGDGSRFGVKLEYILNPDYLGGNAVSAQRARDWAKGEPIVLCMGDHLIEPKVTGQLVSALTLTETLCVDYSPAQHHELAEATKVHVDSAGYIKDIGKSLVSWNALDTGVFLLTRAFFQALDELARKLGIDTQMSDVVRFMVNRGDSFNTCSVSGDYWADVDTPEDLKMARA